MAIPDYQSLMTRVREELADSEELIELMIDHGVGVEPIRVPTLHRINEDFFDAL